MSAWDERDPRFFIGDDGKEPTDDEAIQFFVTREPDRKAKGSARNFTKRRRAQRRPLYVHPHDERHLWLMAH